MCITEKTCFIHVMFQSWDVDVVEVETFLVRVRDTFSSFLTKPTKCLFLYCFWQLVDKHWLVLLQIAWNGNWVYQKTYSNSKWKKKNRVQHEDTVIISLKINSEASLNWGSELSYPHPAGLRQIFRANDMVLLGNPPFITFQICALGHLPDVGSHVHMSLIVEHDPSEENGKKSLLCLTLTTMNK